LIPCSVLQAALWYLLASGFESIHIFLLYFNIYFHLLIVFGTRKNKHRHPSLRFLISPNIELSGETALRIEIRNFKIMNTKNV